MTPLKQLFRQPVQMCIRDRAHTVHLLKNQYHENMEVKVDEIQSEK